MLKHLFGLNTPGAFYEVFLHSATLLSIIVVLRDKIFNRREFWRYLRLSIVATLPLFAVVPFASEIEATFSSPSILPFTFAFTSVLLLSTYFVREPGRMPNWADALIMGLFQTLALLPGISRSGSTISVALHRKVSPDEAFSLSFWMFLPASAGSFVLEAIRLNGSHVSLSPWDAVVWILTFAVGVLSLIFLRKILSLGGNFWMFGIYTLGLSILSAFLFL